MKVGIHVFQTPANFDILICSQESQMFLMTSGIVNPFQKVFDLLNANRKFVNTNFKSVKNAIYVKCNKVNHNKMKYTCNDICIY